MDNFKLKIEDLPDDLKDIAKAIGLEYTIKLIELRGGESVYFRKLEAVCLAARNRAIRKEFNGKNYHELSKKYNLTEAHTRVIIHKEYRQTR